MWFLFHPFGRIVCSCTIRIIYTYKILCFPNSGKYLRTLSKEAENPTGCMVTLEKLAPPEADASLETCTALRKCSKSLQWVCKEPSPAAVLHLKSMEMGWSGPVCPCSQSCDPETRHALLQRTKVADSLWAIRSPGFARRGHHLGACLPQWEVRQDHNCFCLARHKGLLGRLTACFCQSPNVPMSGASSKPAWLGPVCVISSLKRRRHLLLCLE